MCSKEKQFYEILKKYGVKDYWCSSGFDPASSQPCGTVVFRSNISRCILPELFEMYNDIENDKIYVGVKFRSKMMDEFILKDKEYREVSYRF